MTAYPKINLSSKKILVTGGAGFLGTCLVKTLIKNGARPGLITIPRSSTHDLREKTVCREVVKDKDIVIHLAGRVGGIGLNRERPGELFYDNLLMGTLLMEEARKAGVEKFVSVGTVCAYPKHCPAPFKEDDLWNGYPEETNAPYGLAKKMLLVQGQAYRTQHGFNAIFLLPVNFYGPGDKYDPQVSHVIPALIKKFYDAKKQKSSSVTIWGTGKATREFLYIEDAAKAIVLATIRYNKPEPVNIGTGVEINIKDLAQKIACFMDFRGQIVLDITKPDGQPRRCLDTSRAEKEFGFKARSNFDENLRRTIRYYLGIFESHQTYSGKSPHNLPN